MVAGVPRQIIRAALRRSPLLGIGHFLATATAGRRPLAGLRPLLGCGHCSAAATAWLRSWGCSSHLTADSLVDHRCQKPGDCLAFENDEIHVILLNHPRAPSHPWVASHPRAASHLRALNHPWVTKAVCWPNADQAPRQNLVNCDCSYSAAGYVWLLCRLAYLAALSLGNIWLPCRLYVSAV